MSKHTCTLRRPWDLHVHLRQGDLLRAVLPWTARCMAGALVMPNTDPPIKTGADVVRYREEIEGVMRTMPNRPPFEALMSIKIGDDTTPDMIVTARKAGAVAGKVYPRGVTTNAHDGLREFWSQGIRETFRAMQGEGMLLLLHGEIDRERTLVTEREEAFLPTLTQLAEKFPDLKIVLEHVSTLAGIRTVEHLGENIAATITAHHLCLTLNDVIGEGLRPHHACMPMPKGFHDRDALITAAVSGNPKFFLGSDSAPHLRYKKECAVGACGVYTAPVLLPLLMELFGQKGACDKLERFASRFGPSFYGLAPNEETIKLVREAWKVPAEIDGIVPFRAGTSFDWKLAAQYRPAFRPFRRD